MAEIGLVASIFGVAAFGTKVATSLYETGDVMIHAHQQIASMAKHVSQFTAVLRHLGRVLEAEKGNCSEDLLRDIRKIKRSCKGTFKEINATIRSKRFRHLIPVRWLFKKSKAKELEARLNSEQSMLQTMIQSVTVSKLGDIHLRSKEDSKQISGLREEIDHLRTLIVENYNNTAELRRAEQSAEAENRQSSSPGSDMYQGPQTPYNPHDPLSSTRFGLASMNGNLLPRSPSPDSSISESGDEDSGASRTASSSRHRPLPVQSDHESYRVLDDNTKEDNALQGSVMQPLSTLGNASKSGTHRASTLLLQMVPYRPITSNPASFDRSGRLIAIGPGGHTNLENDPKPAMEEATKSVRLLLDKWTTSGSGPVSAILDEKFTEDYHKREARSGHARRERRSSSTRAHRRPHLPVTESSDDDFNETFFPSSNNPYMEGYTLPTAPYPIPRQPARPTFHGTPYTPYKSVWTGSHAPRRRPARYDGDEILNAIRSTGGGIVYTKRNDFKYSHYVDETVVYIHYLVPSLLIPLDESEPRFTEIGKGWVRQEALDLLGYTYSETQCGHFCVSGNLELSEIEELVKLSYQALGRRLEKLSAQIIDERGWRETVNVLKRNTPAMYSRAPPTFPQPSNHGTHPYAGYRGRHGDMENDFDNWDRENHFGPPVSAPDLQDVPPPQVPQDISSKRKTNGAESADEGKSTVPEVRFTLPRTQSNGRNTAVPPGTKFETDASSTELQKARDKLESLMKKKDEAEKAKNTSLASDLTYYAIPEMRERIEKLEGGEQEDKRSTFVRKQARPPPTAVAEMESSESSDGEHDSKVVEMDGSE